MANWLQKINVSDLWKRAENEEISACEMGRELAERLKKEVSGGGELRSIRQAFRDMPEDATFDDFDLILELLYDWADDRHRLWINTFSWEGTE